MNTETQFSCLVVDDNDVARMLLLQLLQQIPSLTVKGECNNAPDAAEFISNNKVDILFLDIEMPGMSGFDLLKALKNRPVTILTTASKNYAEEAFELNVADYIVKPVALPRLAMAVQRAAELIKGKDAELNTIEKDYVFIKENKILKKVVLDEIYWFESKGDYVKIHLADKYYIIHSTLKQMEERLNKAKFIRVHRSYMVALNKIDYMEDNVLYLNNSPIPVSESCKADLFKALSLI